MDESLKEYAELKDVELGNMVLLHENETHFNLIVSKKSDIAKFESLSNRHNVGPAEADLDKDDKEEHLVEESVLTENEIESGDVDKIKKELDKCRKEKKAVHEQYLKCEIELRKKTEDIEKVNRRI